MSISRFDQVLLIDDYRQFIGMKFTSTEYPISSYYNQVLQVSHIVFTNSLKRLVSAIYCMFGHLVYFMVTIRQLIDCLCK